MTDKEMRELDAWIAEKVMGYKMHPSSEDHWIRPDSNRIDSFRPTTDPAAALMVLERCAEKVGQVKLTHPKHTISGMWHITDMDSDIFAGHENRDVAIALFARKVW